VDMCLNWLLNVYDTYVWQVFFLPCHGGPSLQNCDAVISITIEPQKLWTCLDDKSFLHSCDLKLILISN
jgi:hypothetical protein